MATLVFSNPVLWGRVSVAPLWSCLLDLTAGVCGLSTDLLHGGVALCLVKMVLGAPLDLRVRCSEGRPRPSRNAPCLWWPSTPWNAPQSCATKREPLVTKPGQAPWGVDPIGMALYRITALRLNTAGQQCKCSYGKSANWLCTFGGCGGSRGQAPDIQPASRSVHRGVVLPGLARGWMQEPFPAHTILVYSMPQADEAVSGLPVGTLRGLVVLCQGWLLSRPLAGGVRAPPHRRPQRIFGGRDPYASERPSVPRAPRWSWVETRSFACAEERSPRAAAFLSVGGGDGRPETVAPSVAPTCRLLGTVYYAGESGCLIGTQLCDGTCWLVPRGDLCPVL